MESLLKSGIQKTKIKTIKHLQSNIYDKKYKISIIEIQWIQISVVRSFNSRYTIAKAPVSGKMRYRDSKGNFP